VHGRHHALACVKNWSELAGWVGVASISIFYDDAAAGDVVHDLIVLLLPIDRTGPQIDGRRFPGVAHGTPADLLFVLGHVVQLHSHGDLPGEKVIRRRPELEAAVGVRA